MSAVCAAPVSAQTTIAYSAGDKYMMVERSDLRRYDNGVYTGLVSREVRSFVNPVSAPSGAPARLKSDCWYDGSFFVLEETKSNSRQTMQGISASVPVRFSISKDGKMTVQNDSGYPQYRSFPVYPAEAVQPGTSWQGQSVRAVDPAGNGKITRLTALVQYTFAGSEVYKGEEVYRIKAKWATRYNLLQYRDFNGDPDLESASGTHDAQVLVLKDTGAAILIQDTLDEVFVYADGKQIRFKGSTLMFTEFPPAVDRGKLLPALNRVAALAAPAGENPDEQTVPKTPAAAMPAGPGNPGAANKPSGLQRQPDMQGASALKRDPAADRALGIAKAPASSPEQGKAAPESGRTPPKPGSANAPDSGHLLGRAASGALGGTEKNADSENQPKVVVEETPAGIRLSVRDIRFRADSADILPGESERLDQIAAVLKQAPGCQFLIEGHTAAVGKPAGEKTLSVERAKKVAEELTRRGIKNDRFLFAGYGGERPVATNGTREGRALNRRVEITILE